MFGVIPNLPAPVVSILVGGAALVIAVLLHAIGFALTTRLVARAWAGGSRETLKSLKTPSRWIVVLLVLIAVQPSLPLQPQHRIFFDRVAGIVLPALFGWMLIALLGVANSAVQIISDMTVADNLLARRRRTRVGILYRIAVALVLFLTACAMLISIPAVRAIGVTLAASAGLVGLAVGAAAQPALKNLIAGIQMAFTEPIRIDDVVIIDGEWGRIEEIRLSYVVVKIWDERRLVVPVSKFLENSFQNWTRDTSQLLGTAFLFLDPTADVPRLRAKLDSFVRAHPKWDGRVVGLQVTDLHPDHMEVRCLVSAANAGDAFDLRCDVREAMMAYVAAEMPDALMRHREEWLSPRDADARPTSASPKASGPPPA